eukprot:TRINITY_DN31556_c0_g1_i1.p1 TRINITY_DN31556_c0_g1~~TRINITY_DN31556_c0_g1_i1.p1  ORF type:complete len:532 (-),score=74.61 TRINITY_DN31556_c0_g1_i1:100-1530(-)
MPSGGSLAEMTTRAGNSRPTSPVMSPSPRGGDVTNLGVRGLPRSIRSPTPGAHGNRLPREGHKGGGSLVTPNPGLLETVVFEVELHADHDPFPPGLGATQGAGSRSASRSHSRGAGARTRGTRSTGEQGRHTSANSGTSAAGKGTSQPDSAASSVAHPNDGEAQGPKKIGQEERKRAEIFSKWQKIEVLRSQDQKGILERVERGRDRREERFDRLLEAVTGRDNLAYKTALALRERENHEEKRRQELHDAWESKVYQPITVQASKHMNPPDRERSQRETGSKSVDFRLPSDTRRIVVNVLDDPVRGPMVDHARENCFHHVANQVMGNSQSAPTLRDHFSPPQAPGSIVSRARTRPVLEPSNWSLPQLKSTMFGDFAGKCEYGPGFRRALRGGTDVHIPDSSDCVLAAGSTHSRAYGTGDVGILRGDTAAQGESFNFKTAQGASSAAPAQDHFGFARGAHITDMEFPLGKRIFPEFH